MCPHHGGGSTGFGAMGLFILKLVYWYLAFFSSLLAIRVWWVCEGSIVEKGMGIVRLYRAIDKRIGNNTAQHNLSVMHNPTIWIHQNISQAIGVYNNKKKYSILSQTSSLPLHRNNS